MMPPVLVLTRSSTQQPQFKNLILQSLDTDSILRLGLTSVTFKIRQDIEFPGKVIPHLYFVEEGMASITTTFLDGSQVEVGMFGYESVIGASALMGTKHSLNRVYTQIAGSGYRCEFEAAKNEFARDGLFQRLALRNVQAHLVFARQSAGCNAKHSVKQRLARWLLMCADRVHLDHFKISQEFLADMLGNTRPVLTVAARQFKLEKLIEYRRGNIDILDRRGLEACACECYGVVKSYLEDHSAFDIARSA
jgi:CRP-like cAMP-binding protein